MKRVLVIAPHFAPINAPDGHRVRMSLPFYRDNGWEAEVLCVRPEHRPDWRDDSLLDTLPRDVPIHRCGALPLSWTRWLGVGTLGWRCLPFLALAGTRLLRNRKFDLVYFSTTHFVSLLLGPLWKNFLGVPYVVDLQDPWRNDYYDRPDAPPPPGGWKYRAARLMARVLEPWCFRRAAGFTLVSSGYRTALASRYPWFGDKPCAIVPFGTPVGDFALLSSEGAPAPAKTPRVCAAVGALNPAFQTSLEVLFRLTEESTALHPAAAEQWRFAFTGTSYQDPGRTHPQRALDTATRHGWGPRTQERPERVPYLDSLRHMRDADLLLVLGSDDLAYSPSRLHTVCAAGRPVLVVAARGSLLAQRASQIPGVTLADYPPDQPAQVRCEGPWEPNTRFLLDHAASCPAPVLPENLSAAALTAAQCHLWNQSLTH